MAQEIHKGSSSMVRLVDDLLDISRIESGQLALRLRQTDLESLLRSVVVAFGSQAEGHPLSVELPAGRLPGIVADPERIRQVVSNLVSNAIRYSPTGTDIVVRGRTGAGVVRIEVEDHGVGIAADEQRRVFERFYRGSAALTSQLRGSGLGLAIVKHLVEAHGGEVGVDSHLGAGSTFWFTLPLIDVPLSTSGDPMPAADGPPPRMSSN